MKQMKRKLLSLGLSIGIFLTGIVSPPAAVHAQESELSLPEIEQNNHDAYTAIEQLTKAVAEIKAAQPSEPDPADPSNPTKPPVLPDSPELPVPSANPGSSPAPSAQASPGNVSGGVKSQTVTVKAAGYPFTGKGISW